jgi:DNA-binding NtrC family response regulator
VRTARGVAEAEPLPAEGGFAVVVTGLRFSGSDGKDGLEIARLAREHSPQSRVLLLTAYGSAETEAEARQIGVEALLHKPMPLWELARIVMGGAAA